MSGKKERLSMRKFKEVLLPSKMIEEKYVGELKGFYNEDSEVFNIVEKHDKAKKIGEIYAEKPSEAKEDLVGYWSEDKLRFEYKDKFFIHKTYELEKKLFSRNNGILETDWMLDKTAFIIGLGSVGSLISLELAKSGLGRFVLIDSDIVEYHNICRHQAGISDIGKFKVDAMEERLKDINPYIEVIKYATTFESLPKEVFDKYAGKDALFIGAADNRLADVHANKISMMYGSAFLSTGFWHRAFAGEIFYHLPEETMPCYECGIGSRSQRTDQSRRFYVNEDISDTVFEPGIAVDIDYVTLLSCKLAIDIINRFNPDYIPKVIDYLKQYTLVCNTNKVELGGDMAEIFSYPLQITNSLKVVFDESRVDCDCRRVDIA